MDDRFNTPHTDRIELQFLDHKLRLAQDPSSKHLGTTVWDASIVFVKFLEHNCKDGEFSSSNLTGKRIIELGSGCGLASLGMALLGCHVVATDQIGVLPLLLRNVERNMARAKHSPSESPSLGPLGTIEVAELDWGNEEHIRGLNHPFDYIIGTDLVYKEHVLEPLLATLLALAGPTTSIILGYELRSSTVHEKMTQLWKENFDVKIIPKSKMDSKYQHADIQIFNLRRKIPGLAMCNKEGDVESLEANYMYSRDSFSFKILRGTDRTDSTLESIVTVNKEEKDGLEDSKCVGGPDEWEMRRLGSMAARLLQDVL